MWKFLQRLLGIQPKPVLEGDMVICLREGPWGTLIRGAKYKVLTIKGLPGAEVYMVMNPNTGKQYRRAYPAALFKRA